MLDCLHVLLVVYSTFIEIIRLLLFDFRTQTKPPDVERVNIT